MTEDRTSEVLLMLGRLEGKLDGLLSRTEQDRGDAAELEKRVRVLETGWAKLLGIALALSGAVSAAISFLNLYWKAH